MNQGVLAGIRVLDFGRFIAGPFCGALLADHGADVIRVDKVGGSEDRFLLPLAESGEGGLYMQVNRGKRSLSLDPTAPEGREIVKQLIARADVVIANMPSATLRSMGLDYASVSAINPRAILVATNAFGQTGPYAHRLGFDGLGQALSGAVFMSGDPGAPRRASVNWVDFGTAMSAAFGALLALMARERTGRGQEVSGSLMATALTFTNSVLIEQAINQPDRVPQGNLGYGSAPADLFQCADGQWLIVQAVGQPLWRRFCTMLGAPEWLDDARFADDLGARQARPRGERAARRLVRGPFTRRGDPGVRSRARSGRARAQPAASARRRAHPCQRHPAGDRFSRYPTAGAGGRHAGPAVGDAGRDPRPRTTAGRAHRGNPRGNRLLAGRGGTVTRGGGRLNPR